MKNIMTLTLASSLLKFYIFSRIIYLSLSFHYHVLDPQNTFEYSFLNNGILEFGSEALIFSI